MDAESRFRVVFDATYPALARYARHRGLSGHDAEDLVAATYEVAWRRLDVLPAGQEALPWLFTVAQNQLRNRHRKLTQERELLNRLPTPVGAEPPAEPSEISWRDIRAALDGLSADDRELVLLIAWDGLSPTQAGSVLGIKAVAARSRLHRARTRLAAQLEINHKPRDASPVRPNRDEISPLGRSET